MTQEHAGAPYPEEIASMIKDRVSAHRALVEQLENVDMSDPRGAAAVVLPQSAMFIADEGMLPQLAYGIASLLTAIVRKADESQNPMLGLEVRSAIVAFLHQQGEQMEVTQNEDDNS